MNYRKKSQLRLRLTSAIYERGFLRRNFGALKNFTLSVRQIESKSKAFIAKLQLKSGHRCIAQWVEMFVTVTGLQIIGLRRLKSKELASLQGMFLTWKSKVVRLRRINSQLDVIFNGSQISKVKALLSQHYVKWIRSLKHQKWITKMNAKADSFQRLNLMSSSFFYWNSLRHNWKHIYHQTYVFPVLYWAMELTKCIFMKWIDHVRGRKAYSEKYMLLSVRRREKLIESISSQNCNDSNLNTKLQSFTFIPGPTNTDKKFKERPSPIMPKFSYDESSGQFARIQDRIAISAEGDCTVFFSNTDDPTNIKDIINNGDQNTYENDVACFNNVPNELKSFALGESEQIEELIQIVDETLASVDETNLIHLTDIKTHDRPMQILTIQIELSTLEQQAAICLSQQSISYSCQEQLNSYMCGDYSKLSADFDFLQVMDFVDSIDSDIQKYAAKSDIRRQRVLELRTMIGDLMIECELQNKI